MPNKSLMKLNPKRIRIDLGILVYLHRYLAYRIISFNVQLFMAQPPWLFNQPGYSPILDNTINNYIDELEDSNFISNKLESE